jgi:hypothetical protein
MANTVLKQNVLSTKVKKLMTKKEWINFGGEAESKVLEWLRDTRLVVFTTTYLFGDPDTLEKNEDAIYARQCNKILGDIVIVGYGSVDVKRGIYSIACSSIIGFKGKDYILTNTNMERDKTWVIPGHAAKNYVKNIKPIKLAAGGMGYRLKPWNMYTAKLFDVWLKELIHGSKTLSS